MGLEQKITCDGCGADITTTGNSIDYRLKLSNDELPCRGGAVTDMMIMPPIDNTKYFCWLNCLKEWVSK